MLYVIQVRSTEEHKIQEELNTWVLKEGEEAYIPTYELQKFYHGEPHIVKKILFPGYVFCRTSQIDDLFYRLKLIPHLAKLLRADHEVPEFETVSHAEEMQLDALGGPEHNVGVSIGVIENGEVKILSGPLLGFTGPIYKTDRHKRTAIIGVDVVGKELRTRVALEIVYKC